MAAQTKDARCRDIALIISGPAETLSGVQATTAVTPASRSRPGVGRMTDLAIEASLHSTPMSRTKMPALVAAVLLLLVACAAAGPEPEPVTATATTTAQTASATSRAAPETVVPTSPGPTTTERLHTTGPAADDEIADRAAAGQCLDLADVEDQRECFSDLGRMIGETSAGVAAEVMVSMCLPACAEELHQLMRQRARGTAVCRAGRRGQGSGRVPRHQRRHLRPMLDCCH